MKDKQKLILTAARSMLVESGFQDVTLDDIARRAGVAKGTLFLYYKNKDELFTAAFGDLVDQLGANLEIVEASPLSGRALLEDAVRVVLEHFDAHKDFMAQFGAGRFPGCKDSSCGKLIGRMTANVDRVARILKRCSEDKLIAPRDLDSYAAFLFGLCRSSILFGAMKKSSKPIAARRDQVVDMFLNGAGR